MNVVRHVLVILSVVRALGLGDLEDQRVLAALLLARKVDPFLAWGYGMSPADLEVVLAIARFLVRVRGPSTYFFPDALAMMCAFHGKRAAYFSCS